MVIREGDRTDLEAIVRMLADDPLGARRESDVDPLAAAYEEAFEAIANDPNHWLAVAEVDGKPAGTLQLSFIPGLSYQGGWRAQIEGVRVAATARGQGVGGELVRWAIARAAERGCCLVQLTSDKTRGDAIRFYEGLGFCASHEGMKLHLSQP